MAWLSGCGALLAVTSWAIGRVLTDRWAWTQWLFWIPTPAVFIACAAGWLTARRLAGSVRSRRRRLWFWRAATAGIIVWFMTIEHRMLHRAPAIPASGALKVAHWNMGPKTWKDQQPSFEALARIAGDVTIVTNPGAALTEPYAADWIKDNGLQTREFGVFTVLSKLPMSAPQTLVETQGQFISLLQVDARDVLGRAINIYIVDLPSSGRRSRMRLARQARAMLDDRARLYHAPLPPPDLVVGDFNIPRGSASLEALFPGLREAYDEGGHGYGASFHRLFPLLHIDHIRLAPWLRAARYDLMDLGIGRHDAQVAWITSR